MYNRVLLFISRKKVIMCDQRKILDAKEEQKRALKNLLNAINGVKDAQKDFNNATCVLFLLESGLVLGESVLFVHDENMELPFILDVIEVLEGEDGVFGVSGRLISPASGRLLSGSEDYKVSFMKRISRDKSFTFFTSVDSYLENTKNA